MAHSRAVHGARWCQIKICISHQNSVFGKLHACAQMELSHFLSVWLDFSHVTRQPGGCVGGRWYCCCSRQGNEADRALSGDCGWCVSGRIGAQEPVALISCFPIWTRFACFVGFRPKLLAFSTYAKNVFTHKCLFTPTRRALVFCIVQRNAGNFVMGRRGQWRKTNFSVANARWLFQPTNFGVKTAERCAYPV